MKIYGTGGCFSPVSWNFSLVARFICCTIHEQSASTSPSCWQNISVNYMFIYINTQHVVPSKSYPKIQAYHIQKDVSQIHINYTLIYQVINSQKLSYHAWRWHLSKVMEFNYLHTHMNSCTLPWMHSFTHSFMLLLCYLNHSQCMSGTLGLFKTFFLLRGSFTFNIYLAR